MERAASQELSQKRSRRQIIIRYTLEVFQELKQPVSFSIFLAVFRNLLQQWFCLRLDVIFTTSGRIFCPIAPLTIGNDTFSDE